mmetsp:Transcript_83870/g.175460  ORF Transcript_83870/g.175460 Transcript_83870/m.175460 type:complete len:400 (+) Transcript_83870:201-1400(+)
MEDESDVDVDLNLLAGDRDGLGRSCSRSHSGSQLSYRSQSSRQSQHSQQSYYSEGMGPRVSVTSQDLDMHPAPSEGTKKAAKAAAPMAYMWDRHWTENPTAMAMMKPMGLFMKAPALRVRMTQFHGTRIPVLVIFFLTTTELESLAITDKFWTRIASGSAVWQALYCRDYIRGNSSSCRCVWKTLHGKKAEKQCLYHMRSSCPADFGVRCKLITRIPGRTPEELLQAYMKWNKRKKDAMDKREAQTKRQLEELRLESTPAESHRSSDIVSERHQGGGKVLDYASAGLSGKHGRPTPESLLEPISRSTSRTTPETVGISPKPPPDLAAVQKHLQAIPAKLRQPPKGFTSGPCGMQLPALPAKGSKQRQQQQPPPPPPPRRIRPKARPLPWRAQLVRLRDW